MPSPFPGMDPYIEACGRWPGLHLHLIIRCADQLNERLPSQYVATLGERIELIDEQNFRLKNRAIGPDVAILRDPDRTKARNTGPKSSMATLEPHTLPQDVEVLDLPKQPYVEIMYLPEERVVTDIEVLSPSNKRAGSKDRLAYLTKRKNLLVHDVSLVEFDLLLGGERLELQEPLPQGDYFAFVTRSIRPHECDVYNWSVRDPLPTLPIPLRTEDGEVLLDLAAAFVQSYDRGRMHRFLHYGEPILELSETDRIWAAQHVAPD
ncbi:MAG: hypothetical protein JWP03_2388 [Phycisphaerales bacterium]|jgi:hypothetical protein|nr:hypothetical protein [Phycisphaerales bacterium]